MTGQDSYTDRIKQAILQQGIKLKIVIQCRCGNPVGEINTRCKNCDYFISEKIDCDICCQIHKIRPRSFCEALRHHKINDPKTKEKVVMDILNLSPERELFLFGKTRRIKN